MRRQSDNGAGIRLPTGYTAATGGHDCPSQGLWRPQRMENDGMMRSVTVFLLLGTAAGAVVTFAAAQTATQETVTEPSSGTPFPVSLVPPGGRTPQVLMGTGMRRKTIFRLKVYAFGLYVDPEGARASLSQFAGRPASALERDQSFYRRLLELDFAMSVRLVLTRTVSGEDIVDNFNQVLKPRIAQAIRDMNRSPNPEALQRFLSYLEVDEVRVGTEIVMSCNPAGRLMISLGKIEQPPIDSPVLCRAVFDLYLGKNPVSRPGKKSAISRFPKMLATEPD